MTPKETIAVHCLAGASATTWLLSCAGQVLVVDPGPNADEIRTAVGAGEVVGVVCTHAHSNGISGAWVVADEAGLTPSLHPDDLPLWHEIHNRPPAPLLDGHALEVGGQWLDVFHTPGHTPGSICLYSPENALLVVGDALSDHDARDALIELFANLPPETRVLPGHGGPTILANVKATR